MLACVRTFGHAEMCWYVPACAGMCLHVPTFDINLDSSDSDHLDLIWILACVSICGNVDMCWYVPTCANTWNHSQHLCNQPFEIYLECWHVSAHSDMPTCADMSRHVPTCADMSRHVPTCDINIDTSYSDHLHLIWMLPCVSICGHAGMCWYVPTCDINLDTSDSDHFYLIWMLACVSICGHMPTCADMCRYVLTCAEICQHVTLLSTSLMAII